MKWDVVWIAQCYEQLEAIWNSAEDHSALARAAIRIDRMLETDPIENSESREFDQRIIFELPLVVLFVAEPNLSQITVIDVRYAGKRK